eukprot:5356481-Lingulodinium_polyedra.AAC.1
MAYQQPQPMASEHLETIFPCAAPTVADAVNTVASESRTAEPFVSQRRDEEAWLAGWYATVAEDGLQAPVEGKGALESEGVDVLRCEIAAAQEAAEWRAAAEAVQAARAAALLLPGPLLLRIA